MQIANKKIVEVPELQLVDGGSTEYNNEAQSLTKSDYGKSKN